MSAAAAAPGEVAPVDVDAYRRDGFVDGGPLLDGDRVAELRDELDRVVAAVGTDAPQPVLVMNLSMDAAAPVWQVVDIWTVSEPFRRLLAEPALGATAAALTGAAELRVWHDQIQHKPAATGGANHWHQDLPYWPVLRGGVQTTAWIALDDADEDNGAMVMVPGSHRWGPQIDHLRATPDIDALPHRFGDAEVRIIPRPVPAGHVHWHDSLTWHGSPPNRSGRHRRAVAIHLMSGDTCFDSSGSHVMRQHIAVADGAPVTGELFPLVHPAGG